MPVSEYNLVSDISVSDRKPIKAENDGLHNISNRSVCKQNITKVSTKNVCRFTRQLSALLGAGMPLLPALSALKEQMNAEPFEVIIEEVIYKVNSGSSLASALKLFPDAFSNLFINMVAAGEASGNLESVLSHLADLLDRRVELTAKVQSAVAYPLMMSAVAVAVVVFLLSFVVPSITQIFIEMNHSLPWPTRFLISISTFTKTYLVLITVLLALTSIAITSGLRTKKAKSLADRAKLKLPLFGKLFLKLEIARLSRTLGTLLESGIGILDALEISKGVIQNTYIAGLLGHVKDQVTRGDNIANAIRKTELFPPIVFHLVATGQMSGNIEKGLIHIADLYDSEVKITTKSLCSLLEPSILILMGVVVSFIVLAILLPIFEINHTL